MVEPVAGEKTQHAKVAGNLSTQPYIPSAIPTVSRSTSGALAVMAGNV